MHIPSKASRWQQSTTCRTGPLMGMSKWDNFTLQSLLFKHQNPKHYVGKVLDLLHRCRKLMWSFPYSVYHMKHNKVFCFEIYIAKLKIQWAPTNMLKKKRETRTEVSTDTCALTAREPQTFLLPSLAITRAILDHILLNDKNSASQKFCTYNTDSEK